MTAVPRRVAGRILASSRQRVNSRAMSSRERASLLAPAWVFTPIRPSFQRPNGRRRLLDYEARPTRDDLLNRHSTRLRCMPDLYAQANTAARPMVILRRLRAGWCRLSPPWAARKPSPLWGGWDALPQFQPVGDAFDDYRTMGGRSFRGTLGPWADCRSSQKFSITSGNLSIISDPLCPMVLPNRMISSKVVCTRERCAHFRFTLGRSALHAAPAFLFLGRLPSRFVGEKFWPVSLSRKGKLLALESGGKTTSIPVDRYR